MRLGVVLLLLACQVTLAADSAVSFQKEIAPLLLKRCQGCHGPDKTKGGYRLDSFEQLIKPGESGAAPVVAEHPDKSELYRLITTTNEADRMPKKGEPLSSSQIESVREWIASGARFDGPSSGTPLQILVGEPEEPAPPEVYRAPLPITALAFSPDGKTLAASGYHEVTLWDPLAGKLLGRIQKLPERINAIDFSPDGQHLAVAGGEPGTGGSVWLCDVNSRNPGKALDRIGDVMLAVAFSPDGSQLAASGADNVIHLYDAGAGKPLRTIEQHADWVTALAYSPDGKKLASASRDKSARVFSTSDGEMLTAFLDHEEAVDSVAWSQDGNLILSSGRDRKLREWKASDAKSVGKIEKLNGEPLKLLVAGPELFVCTSNGWLQAFSVEKRDWKRDYARGDDWLYSIASDPKHHRLAAGGYSGNVTVWDTESGEQLSRWIASPGYPVPSR